MAAEVELDNLTKDYGSFRALDGVSLQIGSGITGLLGPNGAGKSTLIKVLLGLVGTTDGTGHVLGYSIASEATTIRSLVGYMPEDDCYMHGLSGIESVQVAAQLSRLPSTESLRRGHEILDFCGMGQERYRNVETYSTGMRQKLRFAMSIVHDPKLLILDEPTSGLDPEERESMLNRIRILSRQFGKTILLCTHILPDVQVVCDHVLILAAGQVRLSEKLSVLCESPNPSLTVDVYGDVSKFEEKLAEANLRVEKIGDTELKVFGAAESISELLWKIAADCQVTIRSITPSKNSLEQVFLRAVREVNHAHS